MPLLHASCNSPPAQQAAAAPIPLRTLSRNSDMTGLSGTAPHSQRMCVMRLHRPIPLVFPTGSTGSGHRRLSFSSLLHHPSPVPRQLVIRPSQGPPCTAGGNVHLATAALYRCSWFMMMRSHQPPQGAAAPIATATTTAAGVRRLRVEEEGGRVWGGGCPSHGIQHTLLTPVTVC